MGLCYNKFNPIYYFNKKLHTIDNEFAVVLYIDMLFIAWSWDKQIIYLYRLNLCMEAAIHYFQTLYIIDNQLSGAAYIDIFWIILLWDTNGINMMRSNLLFSSNVVYHP